MINTATDFILVWLILTNLMALSSSRLVALIKIVTAQSIALGFLPLLATGMTHPFPMIFLSVITIGVKGWLFPLLLFKAVREAGVRKEVEPLVGYSSSLLIGIALIAASFWISSRLPTEELIASRLTVPVAFSTMLVGLLVIITRTKAVTQVLGYLLLENGIYCFGVAYLLDQPLLVELGILLDIFVAVFVMGIIIFHISREFDHIDTFQLNKLRDWPVGEAEGEA